MIAAIPAIRVVHTILADRRIAEAPTTAAALSIAEEAAAATKFNRSDNKSREPTRPLLRGCGEDWDENRTAMAVQRTFTKHAGTLVSEMQAEG